MDRPTLPVVRHAGLIARHLGGLWRGVMIEGASGAGKSDLALRALDLGFRLVADDRVVVFLSRGRLFGRAPRPLEGLIEARGVGILRSPYLGFVEIRMIARAVQDPHAIERLPEPRHERVLGVPIPVLELWPREDSAATKLWWALAHLGQASQEAYQASRASPQPRVQGGASGVEGDCR
jgi:serine kinase of HPr protein (carbohydrate metabolism regulator)